MEPLLAGLRGALVLDQLPEVHGEATMEALALAIAVLVPALVVEVLLLVAERVVEAEALVVVALQVVEAEVVHPEVVVAVVHAEGINQSSF